MPRNGGPMPTTTNPAPRRQPRTVVVRISRALYDLLHARATREGRTIAQVTEEIARRMINKRGRVWTL